MPDPLDRWFVTTNGTVSNLVTPLIDRRDTMAALAEQIEQMEEGDFCFYGAWSMDRAEELRENDSEILQQKFMRAVERGATVRLLLFRGLPSPIEGLFLGFDIDGFDLPGVTHIEGHRAWVGVGSAHGLEVIIDPHHSFVGSHHSKYAIFGKAVDPGRFILTAFCGGINLTGLLDDSNHDIVIYKNYVGWHDVHAKIEGPAAEVLWTDFVDRWNANPTEASETKTLTQIIEPSQFTFTVAPSTATHRVEILNTYPCQLPDEAPDSYYPHRWDGRRTIEEAYLNAIGIAEHFIYIESCFFLHQPIAAALLTRLTENPRLQVILVVPYRGDAQYITGEDQVLSALLSSPFADRFHLCDLRHPDAGYESDTQLPDEDIPPDDEGYSRPIFVHSKLMIVDDVYATIGSANADPRSMTHDTEINIGFVDTVPVEYTDGDTTYSVSPGVRDLRVALWREHLQVDRDPDLIIQDLMTIPTALQTWVDHITHASRYQPYTSKAPSRVFHHRPRDMGRGTLIMYPFWSLKHPTMTCLAVGP